MSTPESRLVLHLPLDEVANTMAIDRSVNNRHGQISGDPQVVADATFGSCMRFDGQRDAIAVAGADLRAPAAPPAPSAIAAGDGPAPAAAPSPRSPAHTIAGWVRLERYPSGRAWILKLGQNGAGSLHWLLQPSGATALGVWDGAQFSPTIPLGAWTHIATSYDGARLRCYIDGKLAAEPKDARFNFTNFDLGLAQTGVPEQRFAGSMAGVRAYSAALGPDDIRQIIADDRSARAAFRASHPLAFSLHDADDQPVLAIVDLPDGHAAQFEIANRSGQQLLFEQLGGDATRENHHFELLFRPGVLAGGGAAIKVDQAGWKIGRLQHADGSTSLYLLADQPIALDPGDALRLTLRNIAADGRGGARGSRVELHYGRLSYGGAALQLSGYRTQHISIVNQRGLQHIPLHVGFAGAGTVVNNGRDQLLRLRIVNAAPKPIQLTPSSVDPQAYSRIILSFDAPDEADPQGAWALATESQLRRIKPATTGWSVIEPSESAKSLEWELSPPTQIAFSAGQELVIVLGPIATTLAAGHTNLYVRYKNIPGYWDGQFVCAIEKSPLFYDERNYVGVGTATPEGKLQVIDTNQDANGGTLILGSINASNLRLGYHQNYSWVQSHGGKPLAINPVGNSVGVGTATAQAKLAVNGGVHVGGDSDPGDDNLLVDGRIGLGNASQSYIQRGVSLNWPMTTFRTNSGGSFFANLNMPSAIKIVGTSGGMLSTTTRDVLMWMDVNGIGEVLVNGKIYAQEKNFLIDHPTEPGQQLVHSCIEGPEAGVYYRGSGRLRGGRAHIRLPGYFEALTRAEGRTVQLTPRGPEPFILSYDAVADGGFTVYADRDEGVFDWEVKAVRADVAELQVERPRGDAR